MGKIGGKIGGKVAGHAAALKGTGIHAMTFEARSAHGKLSGVKGGKKGGPNAAKVTNHVRWHVSRNISTPGCELCNSTI
jgi:hypothetical protein